jgi:hypothetical protein
MDLSSDVGSTSGFGTGQPEPAWKVDGTAHLTVKLANGSHSSVTLEAVRTAGRPGFADLPLPSVKRVRLPPTIGPRDSVSIDVTLIASKGCRDWAPGQSKRAREREPRLFSVVADLRTTSGRSKTVSGSIPLGGICPTIEYLPPPGLQPSEPAAARRAVSVAYWTAYDSRSSVKAKADSIDDVSGIPTGLPGGVRSQVHDIVFTSPTSATIVYDIYLDGTPMASDRLGTARLVDGSWRVSRTTICADVELAYVHCS